jgi:hypothetical protein
MIFLTNTPEKQAAREQFKQDNAARTLALKNAATLALSAKVEYPDKPKRVSRNKAGNQ